MARARFRHRAALTAVALCVALPGAAAAQTAPGAEARYQMLAGDPHPGDPDADYALGMAAADAGHYAEAIIAFQRVLAVRPDQAPVRAELARAYALSGDVETARAQFDTVQADPGIPDPVRQRFNRIVRNMDRQRGAGGADLSGFAELSGGYDGNINTATDRNSITLPLFAFLGPATLAGAARSMDSAYVGASGGVSVRAPLSPQTEVFVSALGDGRFNTRTPIFDQVTGTGTAGIAYTTAHRDVVSLSGQVQGFWLGGDRYRNAYGAIGQYTAALSRGRALSVAAQWYRFDYLSDPLRDANRYSASVSYADRTMLVTLSGGTEQTRRPGADNLSNDFVSLGAASEKPVAARISLIGSLAAEHRWYGADDPLFLRTRDDTAISASVGMKLLLTDSLYIRPAVSWTRNFSNIALYAYSRFTAGAALRVEF
jgi:tetratricopeptide (TPR) repeat protein